MTERMLEFQLKLKALLEEYDGMISVALNGAYDLMGCVGMDICIDVNDRLKMESYVLSRASNGALDADDFRDSREPCVPNKPDTLYLGQNCKFFCGQWEPDISEYPNYKNEIKPMLTHCYHEYNTCKTEGNCTEDLCPMKRKVVEAV